MRKILSQKQLDDLIRNMEGAMLECFVKRPSGSMSPLSINILDDDLYIVIYELNDEQVIVPHDELMNYLPIADAIKEGAFYAYW